MCSMKRICDEYVFFKFHRSERESLLPAAIVTPRKDIILSVTFRRKVQTCQ